jgi:hypothetical protein
VSSASIDSKKADGLRAVGASSDTPQLLADLCNHALYEIYVNGQYVESVGNLGGNAQRALDFYRRKHRKQTVEIRIQPCRLPGCSRGQQ